VQNQGDEIGEICDTYVTVEVPIQKFWPEDHIGAGHVRHFVTVE